MRYTLLGRSGLRVSELCLGTMTFGGAWGWGAPEDICKKQLNAFLDRGGNFIDTANRYTDGESEQILGRLLKGRRDEVVLATKYTMSMRPGDPNAGGNARKNMMQSINGSLERLHTDYIDLYWVHAWDMLTPIDEVMRGLDDLVRSGKVNYVGVSDYPAWKVAQANTLAELRGWSAFVGLQIEYSLIRRDVERELVPMARELGIGIAPWSPLGGGILTGKYSREDLHTKEEWEPGQRPSNRGATGRQPRQPRLRARRRTRGQAGPGERGGDGLSARHDHEQPDQSDPPRRRARRARAPGRPLALADVRVHQ